MIASLLAMKAVKDLGVPLKANCRMIMGTNEESGSGDIAWYFAHNPYAPATFSPDAGFPVINTEKGGFKPTFSKSWPEMCIRDRGVSRYTVYKYLSELAEQAADQGE